jgi:hypothetical protein
MILARSRRTITGRGIITGGREIPMLLDFFYIEHFAQDFSFFSNWKIFVFF